MNHRIIIIVVLIGNFLLNCSSSSKISSKESGLDKQKMKWDRVLYLEEQIEHYGTPDDVKLKLKMEKAKILLDNNEYDEAVAILKDVLNSKSQSVSNSEINLYLGQAYYGKSDYGKAINYLSNSEKLDKNFNLHERKKMIAKSLYEEAEYYPALAALGKAYNIPNVKKDMFFYETAAQSYYRMAYTNKSIEHFKKAIQVSELGLKSYPESNVLQRIQKDSLDALGPIHK